MIVTDAFKRFLPVLREQDAVSIADQEPLEQSGIRRNVVDDQNRGAAGRRVVDGVVPAEGDYFR
jgi:hypothetical protein